MNIFKKIWTAIRGGTREIGEAIVDSQGTRIFEQEIEDVKASLSQAKHDLTEVMAKEMQAQRKVDALNADIAKHEQFVMDALDKDEEALALELAGKVAELETQQTELVQSKNIYAEHVSKLKGLMINSEKQLAEYERQLTIVKTTETVQKATAEISDNFSATDSTLNSAKASLERIRQKQEDFNDRYLASEQLEREASGATLEDKMKQVGIGDSATKANAVLARIKDKQTLRLPEKTTNANSLAVTDVEKIENVENE